MEHVNGWCFRGIYKGGLWENDYMSLPININERTVKRAIILKY